MVELLLSDIELREKVKGKPVRVYKLSEHHAVQVTPYAQYTVIEATTGKPPKGLVLRRVGRNLVIDIGLDTNATEILEFYEPEKAAWLNPEGQFLNPSLLVPGVNPNLLPATIRSSTDNDTNAIGIIWPWFFVGIPVAMIPQGGGDKGPRLKSVGQTDLDGPINGVDITVITESSGVKAGDIVTIVIRNSNGDIVDTQLHTVTPAEAISHQFTINTHDATSGDTMLTDDTYTITGTIAHAGGSPSEPVSNTFKIFHGVVHDDTITGAQVFIDKNNDGVLNAGEQVVTSDAQGRFYFIDLPLGASIVAIGGIDTASGVTNTSLVYRAYAPSDNPIAADVDVILSPLSTLISYIADITFSGHLITMSDLDAAAQTALTTLGLGGIGVDAHSILYYDPVAAAEAHDQDGIAVLTANRQIGAILSSIGSLFAGAATTDATTLESSAAVFKGLARAIVNSENASSQIDLTSTDDISTIITNSFDVVNESGITSGLTASNSDDISLLASIFGNVTSSLLQLTVAQFASDTDPTDAETARYNVAAVMALVGNTIGPELKALGMQARTERLSGDGDNVHTDISLSGTQTGLSTTSFFAYSDATAFDGKISGDADTIRSNSYVIETTVAFGDPGQYLPVEIRLPAGATSASPTTPVTLSGLVGVELYKGATHTLIAPDDEAGNYTINFGDIATLTIKSTNPISGNYGISLTNGSDDYAGTLGFSVAPRIDHLYLGENGHTEDKTPLLTGHMTGNIDIATQRIAIFAGEVFLGFAEVNGNTFSYQFSRQAEGEHTITARVVAYDPESPAFPMQIHETVIVGGSTTAPFDFIVDRIYPTITVTVAHVNADGTTGDDGQVMEGASGQVSHLDYTFTFSGETYVPVTVYYYLTPTGNVQFVQSNDFTGNGSQDHLDENNGRPSGYVVLSENNPVVTVRVNVQGDNAFGVDENFHLSLDYDIDSPLTPVFINESNSTILNDDALISVSVVAVEDPQPGEAAFEFMVTRRGYTSGELTLDYTVDGTGQQPVDVSQLAMDLNGSLTFQAGQTEIRIPITTVDNANIIANQEVSLTVNAPMSEDSEGINVSFLNSMAVAGLLPNHEQITISAITEMAMEGNAEGSAGTFVYTVTRSGNVSQSATITYQVIGTGENGAQAVDFEGEAFPSGSITFAPGETSKTISFSPKPNTVLNGDRSFEVALTVDSADANVSLLNGSASGIIMDDECGIGFGEATVLHPEGDVGVSQYQVTVDRIGFTGQPSSAEWRLTPGTGGLTLADLEGGQDLLGNNGGWPSGTVIFTSGETTALVSIGINGNTILESDKSFTLTLSNVSEGTILPGSDLSLIGIANSINAVIVNDDSHFRVLTSAASMNEGQGGQSGSTGNFMNVTVQRIGSTVGEDWVKWTLTGTGLHPVTGDNIGADGTSTIFDRLDHSWIELAQLSGSMTASGTIELPTSGYIMVAYDRSMEFYNSEGGQQIPFDQFMLKQLSVSGGTITSLGTATHGDYIVGSTEVTSSNNQVIFSSSEAQPFTLPDSGNGGHRVTISASDSSLDGMYFRVSGYNQDGEWQEETVKGPDHGTVTTSGYFSSVSQVETVPAHVGIGATFNPVLSSFSLGGNSDQPDLFGDSEGGVPDSSGVLSTNHNWSFSWDSPVIGADNSISYREATAKVTITSEADLSDKSFIIHGGISIGFADLESGVHNLLETGPSYHDVRLDVPAHIRAEQVAGFSQQWDEGTATRYFVISGYDENYQTITEQIAVPDFSIEGILGLEGSAERGINLIGEDAVECGTPGRIMLSSDNADLRSVTFTITGLDADGNTITDIISGPLGESDVRTTVGTAKLFASVSSIVPDEYFEGDLYVGSSIPVQTTHLFSAVTGFVQVNLAGETLPFDSEGGRIEFTAPKDIVVQGPNSGISVSSEYFSYVTSVDVVATPPVNAHVTVGFDAQVNPDYAYHTLSVADVQTVTDIDAGALSAIHVTGFEGRLQYNEGTRSHPVWVNFWNSSVMDNNDFVVTKDDLLASKIRYQGQGLWFSGDYLDEQGNSVSTFFGSVEPHSDSSNFVADFSGTSSVSGSVQFDSEGFSGSIGNPSVVHAASIAYAIFKIDVPDATPDQPATVSFNLQEIGRSGIDVGSIAYSPNGTWSDSLSTQHANTDNLIIPSLTTDAYRHTITLDEILLPSLFENESSNDGYLTSLGQGSGRLQINEGTELNPIWADISGDLFIYSDIFAAQLTDFMGPGWDNDTVRFVLSELFQVYATPISEADVSEGKLHLLGTAGSLQITAVHFGEGASYSEPVNVIVGQPHVLTLADFDDGGRYDVDQIQFVRIDYSSSRDESSELQFNVGSDEQPRWLNADSVFEDIGYEVSRETILAGRLRYVGSEIQIESSVSLDGTHYLDGTDTTIGSIAPEIATSVGSVSLPWDGYIWVRFTNGGLTVDDGADQAWINSLYVDGNATIEVVGQKSVSDGVANEQPIAAGESHLHLNGSAVVHEAPNVSMRPWDNLIALVSPTNGELGVDPVHLTFAAKNTDGLTLSYSRGDNTGNSWSTHDANVLYSRSGMSAALELYNIDPNSIDQLTYSANTDFDRSALSGRSIEFALGNLRSIANNASVISIGVPTTLTLDDLNGAENQIDVASITSVSISNCNGSELQYNEGTPSEPLWVRYWDHVYHQSGSWSQRTTVAAEDIADGKLRFFGNSIALGTRVFTAVDDEGVYHTTYVRAPQVLTLQDFSGTELASVDNIASVNINNVSDSSSAGYNGSERSELQFNEGTADAPNWVGIWDHFQHTGNHVVSAQDIQDGNLRMWGGVRIHALLNLNDNSTLNWDYYYPQTGGYVIGQSQDIAGNPLDNADPMFTHIVADRVAVTASEPSFLVGDSSAIVRQIGHARVTLTSETDLSGDSFIVYGKDEYGNDISEALFGPANGTVATLALFASVTGVELVSGTQDGSLSIGKSLAFSSPESLFAYANDAMPSTTIVVTGLDADGHFVTTTISGLQSEIMAPAGLAMSEIWGVHVQNPTAGYVSFTTYPGDGYTAIPFNRTRGEDGYIDLGVEERITITADYYSWTAPYETYRVTGLDSLGNVIVETLNGINPEATAITEHYFAKLLSVEVGPSSFINGDILRFNVGEIGHPITEPQALSPDGGEIDLGMATAVFNVESRLTFSSTDDLSDRHFTITGTDVNGDPVTETVTGPASGGTIVTTNAFMRVTDIVTDGGSETGSLKIGYATVGGGLTDHFVVSGSGTSEDPITGYSTNTMETQVQFPDDGHNPTVSESDVLLYVNFHGAAPGSVNLHYNLSVQGAPGEDTLSLEYSLAHPTLMNGTVYFADGQSTATIQIPIQGDDSESTDKTMQLGLTTSSVGTTVETENSTTDITLLNDDDTVWLNHSQSASHREGTGPGSPTQFTFTVTRLTDTDAKDVAWELSGLNNGYGSATSADFVATSGLAHFAEGSLTATITVQVRRDSALETNETFDVVLSDPLVGRGYEILAGEASTLAHATIVNDDVGITISAVEAFKFEGNSSVTHTYTVTRTGDLNQETDLTFDVTGTAGDDFLAVQGKDFLGGQLPSGNVHFAAYETQKTITITTVGHDNLSADRGMSINLANAANNFADIITPNFFDLIVEDDPVNVTAVLEGALDSGHPLSQSEGTGPDGLGVTPFVYTLTRSGDLSDPLSLNWSVQSEIGSEWANAADFENGTFPSGVVVFEAGAATAQVTLYVNSDSDIELSNTFNLHLTAAYAGAGAAAQDVLTTISGDDIGFAVDALVTDVIEGNSGTRSVTFTLVRAGSSSETPGDFKWQVEGVAASDDGYIAADAGVFASGFPNGVAHFNAGQESVQITVDIPANSTFADDKGFVVRMYDNVPSPTDSDLRASSQTVVVHNDDARISVTVLQGELFEGSSSNTTDLVYTFHRTGNIDQISSFHWSIDATQTGINLNDFVDNSGNPVLPSGTLTFGAGQTQDITLTLHAVQDSTYEGNEQVGLILSSASTGTDFDPELSSPTTLLLNDDAGFFIASGPSSVTEGSMTSDQLGMSPTERAFNSLTESDYQDVVFNVGWEGNTYDTKQVGWHLQYTGTGYRANADDFVGPTSGILTFVGGEEGYSETHEIHVKIANDRYAEKAENFTVVLDKISDGSSIEPAGASTSAVIFNDDVGLSIAVTSSVNVKHGEGLSNVDNSTSETEFTWEFVRTGDTSQAISFNWTAMPNGSGVYFNDSSVADFSRHENGEYWNWLTMPSADATNFYDGDGNPITDGNAYPSGTLTIAAGQTSTSITLKVIGDSVVETSQAFNIQISRPTFGNDPLDGQTIDDFNVNPVDHSGDHSQSQGTGANQYVTGEIVRDEGLISITSEIAATNLAAANTLAGSDSRYNFNTYDLGTNQPEGDGAVVHHYFKIYREFSDSGIVTVQWRVTLPSIGNATDLYPYLNHPQNINASTADYVAGQDILTLNGGAPSGVATIADGALYTIIDVRTYGNSVGEDPKTFQVSLIDNSATIGNLINVNGQSGIGYIGNDDPLFSLGKIYPYVQGSSHIEFGSQQVQEGSDVVYRVYRSGDLHGRTSIDWSLTFDNAVTGGTGFDASKYIANSSDFTGSISGTLNFADGVDHQDLTLHIKADGTVENWAEAFSIQLSNAQYTNGDTGETLAISADLGKMESLIIDSTVGSTVAVTSAVSYDGGPAADSGYEGSTGEVATHTTISYTLTRSGDTSTSGQIGWALQVPSSWQGRNDVFSISGDTSAAGNEYYQAGLVTFAAGETVKTVLVDVTPDLHVESDGTFTFTLVDAKSIISGIGSAYAVGGYNYGSDGLNNAVSSGISLVNSSVFGGHVPDSGSMLRDAGNYQISTVIKNDDMQIAILDSVLTSAEGGHVQAWEGDSDHPTISLTLVRQGDIRNLIKIDYDILDAGNVSVGTGTLTFNPASAGNILSANGNGNQIVTFYLDNLISSDMIANASNGYTIQLSRNVDFNTPNISFGDRPYEHDGAATASTSLTILKDDVVWSITADREDGREAESGFLEYSFTITRPSGSNNYSGAANVQWSVSGTGGLTGDDFVGGVLPSGTTSFAADETSKTITVRVKGDKAVEADETFTVELTAATYGQIASDGSQTASSIILNDDTAIQIDDSDIVEGDSGTTTMVFTVHRTGDLDRVSSATWTLATATATASDLDPSFDFTGGRRPKGTVEFAIGEDEKQITINIAGDTLPEADETFNIQFSSLIGVSDPRSADNRLVAVGTIENNDTQFSFTAQGASVLEGSGTGHVFTVTRSHLTAQDQTVDWAVTGTGPYPADELSDFVTTSGTVTFHAGEYTQSITVYTNQNTLPEADKGFTVTITPDTGTVASAFSEDTNTATGVILNDDAGFGVLVDEVRQQEGSGSDVHELVFRVHRSGSSAGADTVGWTISGSGTVGDFASITGIATFNDGDDDFEVRVPIVANTVVDGDRDYTITLDNPLNGDLIAALRTATVTLVDDESSVSIADASVTEVNTGTSDLVFTVTRSGASDYASSVDWHVELSGVGGAYASLADFGGVLPSGTLVLAAGEDETTLNISVLGNSLFELNRAFHVVLGSSTDAGLTIASSTATGTILNDDDLFSVAHASEALTHVEGSEEIQTVTFRVQRTGSLTGESTVDWQVTAANGDDNGWGDFLDQNEDVIDASVYTGTVTFADNQTYQDVTITINPDDVSEANEHFVFALQNASVGSSISGDADNRHFVIKNDDFDRISVETDTVPDEEGNLSDAAYKEYSFTITRLDPTKVESVAWSVGGAGDYPLPDSAFYTGGGYTTSGTATFGLGELTTSVTVAVKTDNIGDFSREFALQLDDPSLVSQGVGHELDGVSIDTSTAYATVTNDDPAVYAQLVPNYSGANEYREGNSIGTLISFNLVRSGSPNGTASVEWSIIGSGDNPTDNIDWNGKFPSGRVNFADGETIKTVQARIHRDHVFEQDEGFQVIVSNGVGVKAVNPGDNDSHELSTGVILNDDNVVYVSADQSSIAEGDFWTSTGSFTVTAQGIEGQRITVYAVMEGSGVNQANSSVVSEIGTTLDPIVLVIGSDGFAHRTVDATIMGNTLIGSDETFRLRIASATNASIGQNTAEMTILNDDSIVSIDPTMTQAYLYPNFYPVIVYSFTAHRTGDLSRDAWVHYHVNGDIYDNPETGLLYNDDSNIYFYAGSDTATFAIAKPIDIEQPDYWNTNFQVQLDHITGSNNYDLNAAAIDPAHSSAQVFGQADVTLYAGDAEIGGSGDVLFGGDGNDVIYQTNPFDSDVQPPYLISGGAGNDVIHLIYTGSFVDGGEGIDTVVYDGSDYTLDSSEGFYRNFEIVDLGSAGNTLLLTLDVLVNQSTDVFTVTGSGNTMAQGTHQLIVNGANGDTVVPLFDQEGWTQGADWNYAGHSYHVYNNVDRHIQMMLEDTVVIMGS